MKKIPFIVVLLFLIGVYRFTLIERGVLSIPDEVQYWESGDALEKLIYGHDLRGFCAHVAGISGLFRSTDKPGHITLGLLPTILQGIVWKLSGGTHVRDPQTQMITTGIHFRNPELMRVVTAFKVALSLLTLWLFYRISLLLFKGNEGAALPSTLVYGLLTNTNIYIRHILPYDYALFVFILTLYLALKETFRKPGPLSTKTCLGLGLLSGFGFAVYPGYYFFPVLILGIILWVGRSRPVSSSQLLRYFTFGISFVSILLFYEGVARVGGTTYLGELRNHTSVIIMGSFEEGFTFLPKYLFAVETWMGVFMLACTLFYIFKGIFKRTLENSSSARILPWLLLIMFLGFLSHATLSVSRQMVFYGRLLHMYYPFLVWAMISSLADLRPPAIKRFFLWALVPTLSLLSFLKFATAYHKIAYPLDVLYELGINTEVVDPQNIIHETKPYLQVTSPPPRDFKTGFPYREQGNLILVNFGFFHPLKEGDFKPFVPPKNAKLIYRKPHFQNFPAYPYEGYTKEERKLFKQRNYQVSVYELTEE